MNIYESNLMKIRSHLRAFELDQVERLIAETMVLDDVGDEIQNLIGVYQEKKGCMDVALKHYRAAYALNPTNWHASMNIERIAYIGFANMPEPYYGDELVKYEDKPKTKKIREEGH